jgi:uncharacterized protein YdhG (YjbR/CyaY superfamily)
MVMKQRKASRKRPAKPASAREQVRAYIGGQPPAARARLRQMRAAIRSAAPGAVEGFSYRIPAFRYEGKPLVWYAAFTRHTSLFPMTAAVRRAHASELEGYEMSTGTVRFPLDEPLPVALLKRLVKARIAEVRERGR